MMFFRVFSVLLLSLHGGASFPNLLWTTDVLPTRISSGGIKKHNGIVLSQDQRTLWATDVVGSLHRIRGPNDIKSFQPTIRPTYSTESRSTPSLYEQDDAFLVCYSVIDVPLDESKDVESRVICLNENNNILWTKTLNGAAVGDPQISSDGAHVTILHNREYGVATVLSVASNGEEVLIQKKSSGAPFGPPTSIFQQGLGADVVYWAESTFEGYADAGKMYHMKLTLPYKLETDFLLDGSSVVAPSVSSDGKTMWVGAKEASVYGWNIHTDPKRIWKGRLALSRRNVSLPIVNQISVAGSKLFVSSATNSFHCLNANTGAMIWSASAGPSVYLNAAIYNDRGNVVYAIQHLTGRVAEHNANTGAINWHYDCRNKTKSLICMDSVEAEATLSRDGSVLYYADVYGTVYALQVAETVPTKSPSQSPSLSPSTSPSTFMPTEIPTAFASNQPSVSPTVTSSESPSGVESSVPSAAPAAVNGQTSRNIDISSSATWFAHPVCSLATGYILMMLVLDMV